MIRGLLYAGPNCFALSGLPLFPYSIPGLAPWAFLSRPFGAGIEPETNWWSQVHTPICHSQFSAGLEILGYFPRNIYKTDGSSAKVGEPRVVRLALLVAVIDLLY